MATKPEYKCLHCKVVYFTKKGLLNHITKKHKRLLPEQYVDWDYGKWSTNADKDKAGVKDIPKEVLNRPMKTLMDNLGVAPRTVQRAVEEIAWEIWQKVKTIQAHEKMHQVFGHNWRSVTQIDDVDKTPPCDCGCQVGKPITNRETPEEIALSIIYNGWPDGKKPTYNFDILWQIMDRLAEQANKHNFDNIMDFVFHLNRDDAFMFLRLCITRHPELFNTKKYIKWASANVEWMEKFNFDVPCNKCKDETK